MSGKSEHKLILSLETATRAGSIAVMRGELTLATRRGDDETSHSSHLLESVGAALKEAGATLRDVDVFAVASGPGSFTGLRIGLATAKSFSSTLGRSCVGVPTLHAVALGAGVSACTVALLAAGRGEVFAQRLEVSGRGEVVALSPPGHITPVELLRRLAGERAVKFAGEGAHLYAGQLRAGAAAAGVSFKDSVDPNHGCEDETWALVTGTEPLAVSVAKLAAKRAEAGNASGPEELHAIYVRPSDAELKEHV